MKALFHIFAFISLAGIAWAAEDNLLVNGSFELRGTNLDAVLKSNVGDAQNGYPFYNKEGKQTGDIDLIPAGNPGLTGWKITSGNLDLIKGWQPSHGSYSIDLNGNTPATISQTFATTAGTLYELKFDFSANPGGANDISTLNVQVGNKTQDFSVNRRQKNLTYSDLKYQTMSLKFRAQGPQTTLVFTSKERGIADKGGWIVDSRMYPENFFSRGQQVTGYTAGPVIDNVIVRPAVDGLQVSAKAVPLTPQAKIWFRESSTATQVIPVEENEH